MPNPSLQATPYSSMRKVPDRPGQAEIIGQQFSMLKVLKKTDLRFSGSVLYECICDCGRAALATMTWLKLGRKKSCGCLRRAMLSEGLPGSERSITHGMSKDPTYKTWQGMHQRCANPNSDQYPQYGGRGIVVCLEWSTFEQFFCDMGERPKGKTLDRIDVDGNYEKTNCRWATPLQQANNRRRRVLVDYGGTLVTIRECAERSGLSISGVANRIRRGALKKVVIEGAFIKEGDE